MSDERRKHPRFAMRAEAEVAFKSWDTFRLIYTVNISRGGMALELSREPKQGETITVRLRVPTGAPISLDAVVRHATRMKTKAGEPSRFHAGVEFTNLDAAQRAAIEKTIAVNCLQPLQGINLPEKG